MDQIFTGENKNKTKKKQVEFLTFFEVYTVRVFFNGIFSGLWVNFLVLLSHIPYKKSGELPLACLFEVSTGLWLFKSTSCMITLNILSVYWFYQL